jgi:hypothetical protein
VAQRVCPRPEVASSDISVIAARSFSRFPTARTEAKPEPFGRARPAAS